MIDRLLKAVLVSASLLSLGACASLPQFARWAPVKPVPIAPQAQAIDRGDAAYAGATAAISRGHYARALELLQVAREHRPDDVRVLNAFGVVYDKLGRFDLSSRYYGQAKALDPSSQIVVHNIAYSQALRAQAAAQADFARLDSTPVFEVEPATPATSSPVAKAVAPEPVRTAQQAVQLARPAVIRLSFAPDSAVLRPGPLLTGRPLEIRDASGRGQAEGVRIALAKRGWSAPKVAGRESQVRARSLISYPAGGETAAKALARTLPGGAQLVVCRDSCAGLRLIVGADAGVWGAQARPNT